MEIEKINIEKYRELIHKGEATDPLIFLESIMMGQDPRRLSSIYELVNEIDGFSGQPTTADWKEIVEHVNEYFKYHIVSLSESHSAANTLAQYLHAKRKHVEINENSDDIFDASKNPLTEEEIELFKEKFNDEF